MRSWKSEKGRIPRKRSKSEFNVEARRDPIRTKLDATKARGIGILMDQHKYGEVDKVIISIGPKFDMELTWDDNPDDDEWYVKENLIEHVPHRYGMKGDTMCITVPAEERDRKFIMDTGSGHDLISMRKVNRLGLESFVSDQITFHTANGPTVSDRSVSIDIGALDRPAIAHVLEDTPPVLSVGKRCMDERYSFIWNAGKNPYLINKDGMRIDLTVKDYIPYILLGDPLCDPYFVKDELLQDQPKTVTIDLGSGDEMVEEHKVTAPRKGRKQRRRRRSQKAVPGEADEDGVDPGDAEIFGDDFYGFGDSGDAEEVVEEGPGDAERRDGEERVEDKEEGLGSGDRRRKRNADDEKDEDDVDVDDEVAGPNLHQRGTLRSEANKIEHILTHRYKNPYCDACVRAKMRHHKTYRGAFRRKLKKFGDLVTFDFVDTREINEPGHRVEKEVLVIRDRFTGMIGAHPSTSKSKDDVIVAFKHFLGKHKCGEAYSDRAPKELKIPWINPYQEEPKPIHWRKGIISSSWRQRLHACYTLVYLLAFGGKRSNACAISSMSNPVPRKSVHGVSFMGKFNGLLIPFGAQVYFKPSKTHELGQSHKFDPKGVPGIFAGYEIRPGFGTGGERRPQYRVWAMEDFALQNLAFDAKTPSDGLARAQVTEQVVLHEPIAFPCKKRYEEVSATSQEDFSWMVLLKLDWTMVKQNRTLMTTMRTTTTKMTNLAMVVVDLRSVKPDLGKERKSSMRLIPHLER